MPQIKVTSPEGQTAIINAPEGATQEEIRAYAMAQFAQQTPRTKEDMFRRMQKDNPNQPTSPEREAAMQDSFFLGWGNEAAAGLEAATGGQNYGAGLAEREALKAQTPYPLLDAVGPAMLGGTGLGRLISPASVKGAIGLGAAEGGITGAGMEKQGDRGKGAVIGTTLGGVASAAVPLAVKLTTQGVPRAVKGFNDMFGGTKPQGEAAAAAEGDTFLANFLRRTGLTKEKALDLSKKKYGPDETLADATSEQSSILLPGLAASSDEAAEIARKSPIATRQEPDTLMGRVQGATGAGTDKNMELVTKSHERLKKVKKGFGDKIEEYVDSTIGEEVVDPAAVDDFFALDAAKGLKKEVNKSLQLRKRGPTYADEVDDAADVLDEAGDANKQVYDAAFLQETSSRLGKRISQLKKEGIDYADEVELKKQFDEIFDDALKDTPIADAKKAYGAASRKQRAFESGLSGKDDYGKPFTERLLKNEMSKMSPEDLRAFKVGALDFYAEKGDGLLKALGSPAERRKIGLIFGSDKAELAKEISQREAGFASVSERLTAGTTAQSQQVAKETLKGDLTGIDSLFKRLENKRAYSGIGAAGLFINEVISIIHKTDLSDQAIKSILKKVSVSGDEVNKALKRIAELDIPKLERDALLKEEMVRMAKAKTSGYGAAAGSLSERVTGGIGD